MTRYGERTRLLAWVFCGLLLLSAWLPTRAAAEDDIASVMAGIVSWKEQAVGAQAGGLFVSDFASGAGTSAADWFAIAMGRTGVTDDYASYLALLKTAVQNRYAQPEKLDAQKATEWHRVALAVLALGGDPTDMGTDAEGQTIDLIRDGTYDRGQTASLGAQGINAYIWGLLTLDSMRYVVPEGAADTREDMIRALLQNQLSSGAFSLDGTAPDVDITAMALQALAPYYNDEKTYDEGTVRQAVDCAVQWLSSVQRETGDFAAWGQGNAESTVQVLVALCTLGIDPEYDSRFLKNGNSVLDGLMIYRMADGGFAHSVDAAGEGRSNPMASEQALYGLCALYRCQMGLRHLYDLRPEPDEETRAQIAALNDRLKTIPDDREGVAALFEAYLAVPVGERSYVVGYDRLADAMEAWQIPNTAPYLVDSMDECTGGAGTVTDIFDPQAATTDSLFTEDDLAEYRALPDPLTGEQYTAVVRLYEKLQQADNAADYADIAVDLTAKKQAVEDIRAEIDRINAEIAEQLYPFDAITKADKETVYDLAERAAALSDYDRAQILGYEDLLRAKAQLDSGVRRVWIAVAAAVLVVACVLALLLRRQNKKRQKQADVNEDW